MSENPTKMRRFYLERIKDASGVSGTGIVAEGCELSNGFCILTWLTRFRSIAMYATVKELIAVHGHGGDTKLVFLDPE